MASIVVVGSYGVGMTMTMDRAPEAGETVLGRTFSAGPGGKGSNQAIAAARLGARSTLCTVVGADEHGRAARQLWAGEGVGTDLVRTLDGSTMLGLILVEASGENRIAIAPGVLGNFGAEHLDDLDAALESADLLLVGLEIPLGTAFSALRSARRAGVTTVLNPAPAPSTPIPPEMLALVDHLTPNRTEAARISGLPADSDPAELLDCPRFADIETVVVTLGADGVVLRDGATVHRVDAITVDAVDTTGAGDAFNAAYAVRLADGYSAQDAAEFAVRAAAFSVTTAEVIPSLPFLDDVLALGPATGTAHHTQQRTT